MVEPHTIAGLIRKRSETAGRIEHHQSELRQAIIDLDNLDHTIRLFDPDVDLQEVKPKPLPPRHQAYQGELTRIVLSVLRQSGRPLTTHELAQHVMAERGLNTADKRLVKIIGKRVGACLRSHRAKGLVRSELGPEHLLAWKVTE